MNNISKSFLERCNLNNDWTLEHKILDKSFNLKESFPKITIITPSYNQGNYLETTIRSVLLQNYPNLEYLIIDGGSTDNSVNIIKKYSSWITYWVSEKDGGQSDAINKGLKIATGEIINWLNSDDYYEPGTLLKVAQAFRDKNTLMVGGRSFLFINEREIIRRSNGTDVYSNNLAKTIGWARIDQPETFFRKEVIDVMGPLNHHLHYLMDRDWWIKFLFHFGLRGVKKIPDFLVNFRLHEQSKTVSHGDNFQIEHDSYFYKLAKKANLHSVSTVIKDNTCVRDYFELDFEIRDYKLVEQAIHYYMLLRADQYYINNESKKAHNLLNSINRDFLQEEDFKHWRKVFFRNKYIPAFALQVLRRK